MEKKRRKKKKAKERKCEENSEEGTFSIIINWFEAVVSRTIFGENWEFNEAQNELCTKQDFY